MTGENRMAHWHYQILEDHLGHCAVHEVYHMDDGSVAWTENPVAISGESPEDIEEMLTYVLRDITKYGIRSVGVDEN